MQDSRIPLLSGLVPILTVLGVQLILAVASMPGSSPSAACYVASR